jgi:hypothetical protein
VLILPDSEIVRRDPTLRRDGRGLGNDHPGAPNGSAAERDQVPVGGEAIDGGILAHRTDADAVAKGDAADGDRIEQGCHDSVVARNGHW